MKKKYRCIWRTTIYWND